jgi:hypothetical protein
MIDPQIHTTCSGVRVRVSALSASSICIESQDITDPATQASRVIFACPKRVN